MAEEGGRGVSVIGIDQLTGDYSMTVESLAVCDMGMRKSCIGRGIEPTPTGEDLFRKLFEFVGILID